MQIEEDLESNYDNQWSFYVNNFAIVTGGSQGFNVLEVGGGRSYNEWSICEVSFILVYNRLLSTAEMTKNFDVLRGRFNI
jgi:hypothetical protein